MFRLQQNLEEEGFRAVSYADFWELTPEEEALIETLPIPQLGADSKVPTLEMKL